MKTLLFSLAMLLIVPSVVFAGPPLAQKMQPQPLEAQQQGLETEHRQTKAERKQLWRKMYQQDMKRLIKRLQAVHPVG
jgi:hypothetical protein